MEVLQSLEVRFVNGGVQSCAALVSRWRGRLVIEGAL